MAAGPNSIIRTQVGARVWVGFGSRAVLKVRFGVLSASYSNDFTNNCLSTGTTGHVG